MNATLHFFQQIFGFGVQECFDPFIVGEVFFNTLMLVELEAVGVEVKFVLVTPNVANLDWSYIELPPIVSCNSSGI